MSLGLAQIYIFIGINIIIYWQRYADEMVEIYQWIKISVSWTGTKLYIGWRKYNN
jgi:hypothetical protein